MITLLSPYIIIQCLLFGIALVTRAQAENRYLGLFFLLTAFQYFLFEVTELNFFEKQQVLLIFAMDWIGYFKLPVLIHYFRQIHQQKVHPWQYHYSIWILPGAVIISFMTINILNPFEKIMDYQMSNLYKIPCFFISFSFVLFCLLILKTIHKALKINSSQYSHYQKIKLSWGKWLLYFQILRSGAGIIFVTLLFFNNSQSFLSATEVYWNNFSWLALTLMLTMLGYLALRNPDVFNSPMKTGTFEQKFVEIILPQEEKVLTKKMILSEQLTENYLRDLKRVVDDQKAYLDNELDQNKLSKLTHIPRQHLSHLINKEFNKNFQDFINSYRVEHAKKLLSDSKRSDDIIYMIALESGFNSERTFYAVFKQSTGYTPKQYKSLRSQNPDITHFEKRNSGG